MSLHVPDVADDDGVLAAAFEYAAAGWYVLPIDVGTKRPAAELGKDWGAKSARDTGQIVAWFSGTSYGLGLHVGRSGAVAFDVDNPEAIPEPLRKAIDECRPPCQRTRTGTDRGHYLFRFRTGRVLGNGAGKLGGAWGEVRGRGGQIVVAPTAHQKAAEGGRYHWERTGDVPELPAYVDDLLHEAAAGTDAATDAEVLAFIAEHTRNARPELLDAWAATYRQKVAEGESRHQRMVSIAAGAFSEARAGYFPARAAMERLEVEFLGAVAKQPLPGGRQGAARTGARARSEWMGISAWAVAQAGAAELGEVHARVEQKMPDLVDWIPDEGSTPAPAATTQPSRDQLTIRTLADVAAEVDARPPRPWLFEPVWAAGDYGVMSAQDKAGKTWAILDAALSCAAGASWLGQYPARAPGPVLVFLGEGSDAKMLRRLRAIGAHKGIPREQVDALPILLCFRAPQLGKAEHLDTIAATLAEHRPALSIIDPLYLAAAGANGADLYAMGAMLGNIQHIAQEHGSGLMLAHHWNKTGEGNGHSRSSGVGPGAWGRVLISVAVLNSRTDPATQETTVRLKWSFKGDEIPETDAVLVRWVRADDPGDLNSPLHYRVERAPDEPQGEGQDGELRPAARRVLNVLRAEGRPLTVEGIGDILAETSKRTGDPPLKKRTIQDALKQLAERGRADSTEGIPGGPLLWIATSL